MNAMKVHDLKCWPEPFEALIRGVKTFEVRKNDRNFSTGDFLRLAEWDPETREYTGREADVFVPYVLFGPAFGLPAGMVVMAVQLRETRE